jgi:hypothetical protein
MNDKQTAIAIGRLATQYRTLLREAEKFSEQASTLAIDDRLADALHLTDSAIDNLHAARGALADAVTMQILSEKGQT